MTSGIARQAYAKGKFLADSWADSSGAQIQASNYAGGYGINGLISPDPDLIFRTENTDILTIDIIFTESVPIDGFVLAKSNLSVDGYINYTSFSDEAMNIPLAGYFKKGSDIRFGDPLLKWGDPDLKWGGLNLEETVKIKAQKPLILWGDSTIKWGDRRLRWGGHLSDNKWPFIDVQHQFEQVSRPRAVRLEIHDTHNKNGFIEIGRLKIGEWRTTQWNFLWGHSMYWEQVGRKKHRKADIEWDLLEAERNQFNELIRTHGSKLSATSAVTRTRDGLLIGHEDDIYFMSYPDKGGHLQRDHAALVALTGWSSIPHVRENEYKFKANLEEVYSYAR